MNRTLRARLSGGTTLILKQAVPWVAKYPQIPAPVDRLQAEAAFYRTIAGCEALCRHTPKLLGEDPAEHLLCLEDLGEGGDLTRLYTHGPSPRHDEQIGVLVDWLGTLHGLAVDPVAVPDNGAMRQLNYTHIFDVPFSADSGVNLSAVLREQQAHLGSDPDVRRQAWALGDLYLGANGADRRTVLLHGDYYPGSWLEHPERTVAVIDPEFAFAGPPEFDVGVFTAHLLMAGYPEAAIADHLSRYREPAGFSAALASGFAGIEVIRRLLGVAQLPLDADDDTRSAWLDWAREAMIQ